MNLLRGPPPNPFVVFNGMQRYSNQNQNPNPNQKANISSNKPRKANNSKTR